MTKLQRAYLIGLAAYPNHYLAGVPNDLALMRRGLERQGFAPAALRTFGDEVGTLEGLRHVLTLIDSDFRAVTGDATTPAGEGSHCFFYFSGSGLLAVDPLLGGMKPLDGDELDFRTALTFAELNRALPVRPGVQVTVVLDC